MTLTHDSKSLSRTLLIMPGIHRQGRESFPDSVICQLFPRPEWSLISFKFFGCCFLFFKIDVYNFGVLLYEMCTFKQFTDPQKRLAQVNIYGEKQWPAETCASMSEDKSQGKTRHDRDHKWLKRLRWNRLLGHSLFTRSVRNMPVFANSLEARFRETSVYLVLSVMVESFS